MATALTDLGGAANWTHAVEGYRRSQSLRFERALSVQGARATCADKKWNIVSNWRDTEHATITEQEEDFFVDRARTGHERTMVVHALWPTLPALLGGGEKGDSILSNYVRHNKVFVQHPRESVRRPFLIEMDNVELIGRGGLVVSRQACSVFTGTHAHLRTIPKNLGASLSRPVNTRVNGKNGAVLAMSVITSTSSSTNFFHWVAEGLVRLDVLLRHRHLWNENAVLLVPRRRLVNATLNILASRFPRVFRRDDHLDRRPLRIARYDSRIGFRAGKLIMVDWEDGDGGMLPSAPHPPTSVYWSPRDGTLRAAHALVVGMLGMGAGQPGSFRNVDIPPDPYVLYCSRRAGAKTRVVLGENMLLKGIRQKMEYRPVLVHDGTESLADQIRLFRSAGAIVGPHGAGLAGMVFATKERSPPVVVFPLIGEQNHAGYYGHLARSHGLAYWEVPALRLWRTGNVTLSEELVAQIVATIETATRHGQCRERIGF